MNDVLSHVVLAPSDKDLGAGNIKRAIAIVDRFSANNTQISTGVRLGQIHRS